jgi:hypothetical protein
MEGAPESGTLAPGLVASIKLRMCNQGGIEGPAINLWVRAPIDGVTSIVSANISVTASDVLVDASCSRDTDVFCAGIEVVTFSLHVDGLEHALSIRHVTVVSCTEIVIITDF